MTKKLALLFGSLICMSSLQAQGEYELSFKYGLTSLEHEDGMTFENNTLALDGVYDMGGLLKPRVDLNYVLVHDEKRWGGVSSLVQGALGAQYAKTWEQIPFAHETYVFAGLGYEVVVDGYDQFDSLPFMQAGLGVKYGVTEAFNLLGEFKAMQAFDGNSQSGDEDNEFAIFIGVNMPLNGLTNRTIRTSQNEKDNAILLPSAPVKMEPSQEIVKENPKMGMSQHNAKDANVTILFDSDGDGITDDIDSCPKTELGVQVDSKGCAPLASRLAKKDCASSDAISQKTDDKNSTKKGKSLAPDVQNIDVKFAEGMAIITAESLENIKKFATYIKSLGAGTIVTINAYTDGSGKPAANKKLSSKRAFAVRKVLIAAGLKKSLVRAYGLGAINPIADNATAEGRVQNRRIEAVITH